MSAEKAARRQDLVKQISAFGFSEERAAEALKRASSVDAAVGWLMDIDDEAADESAAGGAGGGVGSGGGGGGGVGVGVGAGADDGEWLAANVDLSAPPVREGEFSQKKVTLRWKVTVDQHGQSSCAKKVVWEVENNREGAIQITNLKVQANAEQGMPPVPDAVLSGSKYPNNKPILSGSKWEEDGPACIIAPGEVGQVLFPVKSSVEVAPCCVPKPTYPAH